MAISDFKTPFLNKILMRFETAENLDEQIQKVLDMKGPVLCEVILTPRYIFAPKLSAKKLPDGSMVSPSLEDLFPFLPKEEVEGNMIK